MPEGGFFETKRSSPVSLGVVILLHGAAIIALAMAKMEMPEIVNYGPTDVYNVPIPPEPPPAPPEQARELPDEQVTYRTPVVPLPVQDEVRIDVVETIDPPRTDIVPNVGRGDVQQPARPLPPPEPVRVEARIDPRSELQPPYPPAEERAGNEGKVSIRVVIGTDGRVKAAEKVSAASDAFYRATERHALRAWRFTPATVDGRPVESRRVMTVEFRLTG